MKNRLIYVAVVVSMVLALVAAAMPGASPAITVQAAGNTWHVDDNLWQYPAAEFTSIQEALDNASVQDGDTIMVYAGTYSESLNIEKAVTILAFNGSAVTTIDAGGNSTAVKIDVNGVTFGNISQGFTIFNAIDTGIDCYHYDMTGNLTDIRIAGNTIHGCEYGISFDQEADGSLRGNTIIGNTIYDCEDAGIYFDNCNNYANTYGNTISDNVIYNCGWAESNYYDGGIIFDNDETFGNIHDNTIENNNITDCHTGISFNNSYDGTATTGEIYGNTLHNNSINNSEVGIVFENQQNGDLYDNTVDANSISNCELGVIFENNADGNVRDNTVSDNNISLCGWGIEFDIWSDGNASDNTISGNTIRDCGDGIGLYDIQQGGDISGNSIDDNSVYNCSGSGIELWSESYECIIENTVSNNRVDNCSDGILLYSEYYGNLSLNTVEGNTISNCTTNGIRLYADDNSVMYDNTVEDNTVSFCPSGIYLYAEYNGYMEGNDILDNHVEYQGYGTGIYLYAYNGGHIGNSTIEDNEVYSDSSGGAGITLYDESTLTIEYIEILGNTLCNISTGEYNYNGIYVYYSSYININGNYIANSSAEGINIYGADSVEIISNAIHNNSEGIYLACADDIYIAGNDIRDNNPSDTTGIYIADCGSECEIWVECNNIVNNGYGIYNAAAYSVDADDNWWGDDSGPSGEGFEGAGDEIYGNVSCETWLTEELTFDTSSVIVDAAAVPETVSLLDGNIYTELIVEVDCNLTCESEYATADLSKFLLDMLPSNFEEEYVSRWEDTYVDWWNEGEGAYLSDIWQEWMDYLAVYPMNELECDACGFELEFSPIYLLDYGPYGEEVDELSLPFFFCTEVGGYSQEDVPDLWRVIFEELRMGEFQIPVTVYSCWGGTDTSTIPLTLVDTQIPLADGWNLRSVPVALDPDYTSWGTIREMADGIPGLEAAIRWNDSAARWEELVPGTTFEPLQAYFIKVSGNDTLPVITNRDLTGPYSRQLSKGWNLVGPAPYFAPFFFSEGEPIWTALYTVQEAAGNTTGWINASSVSQDVSFEEEFYYKDCYIDYSEYYFSQCGWSVSVNGSVLSNECEEDPSVTLWGGYWVYMQNADELAGTSFTPMPWEGIFWMID